MATILIIEDRPIDRKLLTTILQTQGHDIVEASDGEEALETVAQIGPDVVISDILMPTVDGYEFVRRMRRIPALAATPVIFCTAMYHEREARALARQCGVVDILTKPSTAQTILATVKAALGSSSEMPPAPDVARDHLHLVRAPLASGSDRFEAEQERTKILLEIAVQIAAERDPLVLLNKVCTEARDVTLAQHAVVGLLAPDGSPREMLYTSGLDAATTAGMKPPSLDSALFAAVVRDRRPVRTQNPDGRPEALGFPADHPPVSSLLSVPIASSSRVYGWLSLQNKLGTDRFTDVDERAATTLAAHAGIAYETAYLFDDLHRRASTLEEQFHRTSVRIREEERARLSRTLHDQMGQVLAGLKMDVHWLAVQLRPVTGSSRGDITEKVDSILQRLDETIASVRTTASELRPAVLEKLGLVAAFEWQAEEFERRSGIRCRVDSGGEQIELDSSRATAVFNVVQEALTNVLRHAHATRANVTVRRSAKALTVSVTDNGRGISDGDLANGRSLGLIGIRERAALLGGEVDVRRRRPAGTVVKLTVPLIVSPLLRG